MKVGLLVSDNWKNKCDDNLMLINEFRSCGVDAREIAWNVEEEIEEIDFYIIKSTWGYQHNYLNYLNYLKNLSEKKVLMNSYNMVFFNIFKDLQIKNMQDRKIPIIETIISDYFEKDILLINRMLEEGNIVLKPNISASGNDTMLINENISENTIKEYFNAQVSYGKKVIIQRFQEEINDGEISLIYCGGFFSHSVKRYPGVLGIKRPTEYYVADNELIKLGNEIMVTMDLTKELYTRIDIILTSVGPRVMEIELNEPDLFYRKLPNSSEKLKSFVNKSIEIYERRKSYEVLNDSRV